MLLRNTYGQASWSQMGKIQTEEEAALGRRKRKERLFHIVNHTPKPMDTPEEEYGGVTKDRRNYYVCNRLIFDKPKRLNKIQTRRSLK
nr:hypothetical protein [Tanacetum cinerariifolium]